MTRVVRLGLIGIGVMTIAFVAGPWLVATAQELDLELIDKFELKQPKAVPSTNAATEALTPEKSEFLPRPSAREQRILNALSEPTEVSFTDTPLEECLNYLKELHHIEIWIDKQALTDEGVNSDQPVTLQMSAIALRSTLKLILEPMGLTYIAEDDVMKITAQSKAGESISTRTYPVGDLFRTREDANELVESLEAGMGLPAKKKRGRSLLTVSVTCGAIIARLSGSQHDQMLQLIRDLREAKSLKPKLVPTAVSLPTY
jgi:hypothetical protein